MFIDHFVLSCTSKEATEEVIPDEVVDDDQSLQVSPRNNGRRCVSFFYCRVKFVILSKVRIFFTVLLLG